MIKELNWDSNFFNKKIGEIDITNKSISHIEDAIKKARIDNFKYIIYKAYSHETDVVKKLESIGFYLSDIGIILEYKLVDYNFTDSKKDNIKIANDQDICSLKKMTKSLFRDSRFYTDSFFTEKEADDLFQIWIENSIKGDAADIVFIFANSGFVTCKKSTVESGEVVLIGVHKEYKKKGIGSALLKKALQWFKINGCKYVCVRTQLRNVVALNFYIKAGFYIKKSDLVFAMIL